MVYIDVSVYNKIADYITYVVSNGLCSSATAIAKSTQILDRLNSLDCSICTDTPSTHRSFGKSQGYLYGFFKDKKSKTQRNYLYERIEEDGIVKILVHDICCGGLKDSIQFYPSLYDMLCESSMGHDLTNDLQQSL